MELAETDPISSVCVGFLFTSAPLSCKSPLPNIFIQGNNRQVTGFFSFQSKSYKAILVINTPMKKAFAISIDFCLVKMGNLYEDSLIKLLHTLLEPVETCRVETSLRVLTDR